MWSSTDDFLLVLQAGQTPLLRIGVPTASLPSEVRRLASATAVEHRPWRGCIELTRSVETVIDSFDRCLLGVRLCWDGQRLTVQRGMESTTHVFVGHSASRVVIGSTLDAVRAELDATDLRTDVRALLDLHFFGRVLPPFTLHLGISSLDLGVTLAVDREGLGLRLSWCARELAVSRLAKYYAATQHATRPASGLMPLHDVLLDLPVGAFDLIPQCATLTGLPTGDLREVAYLGLALSPKRPLPDPLEWATVAGAFTGRSARAAVGWPGGLLSKSLATDELMSHRNAWLAHRSDLLESLRQALRQPACKGLSATALLEAAVVLPDRVARVRRIATACGHAAAGNSDWLQAAAGLLHATRRGAQHTPAGSSPTAAAGWGDNPVDRMSMLTLQQRPGCVSQFFPMSPLRACAYRRALRGPAGASLFQRLGAILAAQLIEEQVIHSRSFHLEVA